MIQVRPVRPVIPMRPISASKHKMKLIPSKQNLVESNQDGKDTDKNLNNKKHTPCKLDKVGGSEVNQIFHDPEGFKYKDFDFKELPKLLQRPAPKQSMSFLMNGIDLNQRASLRFYFFLLGIIYK